MPESDEYQLSDDELDSIFYQTIVPVLFDTAPLAEYPLAILIGAQPGAGKSQPGGWPWPKAASRWWRSSGTICGRFTRATAN